MKTKILTCFFLLCFYKNGISQIPNASFEDWNSGPILNEWISNSYPQTLPPWNPYIVMQDTDRVHGVYSANLIGNGIMKPFIRKTFQLGTVFPQSLSLSFKLVFPSCVNDSNWSEKDTVAIKLTSYNNGFETGFDVWESSLNQFSWTHLIIPITNFSQQADSFSIEISGGKVFGGCGIEPVPTEFKVDNLTFVYTGNSCVDSSLIDENTICLAIYDPVCGCNGVTYSNACEAVSQHGIVSYTGGECSSVSNCSAFFDYSKDSLFASFENQSSYNGSASFLWSFGDGSTSSLENPQHTFTSPGWYTVCLSVSTTDDLFPPCVSQFCSQVYIHDGCIDSSIICLPGSLCCDAPLFDPVCGCNGLVYDNACVAASYGGNLSFTAPGNCDIAPRVNEVINNKEFKVYPNPNSGIFYISSNFQIDDNLQYKIYNSIGLFVTEDKLKKEGIINYHLPNGLYMLKIIYLSENFNVFFSVNN